jgi:hypothetical protein
VRVLLLLGYPGHDNDAPAANPCRRLRDVIGTLDCPTRQVDREMLCERPARRAEESLLEYRILGARFVLDERRGGTVVGSLAGPIEHLHEPHGQAGHHQRDRRRAQRHAGGREQRPGREREAGGGRDHVAGVQDRCPERAPDDHPHGAACGEDHHERQPRGRLGQPAS